MKAFKKHLAAISVLYLPLAIAGCVQGATQTHSPQFADRVAVVNEIKQVTEAKSVTFTIAMNMDSDNKHLSTDLLIDIVNARPPSKNANEFGKQIVRLTKHGLTDTTKFDAFKVTFFQTDLKGNTLQNETTQVTFKPEDL